MLEAERRDLRAQLLVDLRGELTERLVPLELVGPERDRDIVPRERDSPIGVLRVHRVEEGPDRGLGRALFLRIHLASREPSHATL